MSEKIDNQPPDQNQVQDILLKLKESFPLLDTVPLHEGILNSPELKQLGRLVELSIPIEAYPSNLISLYEKITSCYYSHLFRNTQNQDEKVSLRKQEEELQEQRYHQQSENVEKESESIKKVASKINYLQLATYIKDFCEDQEVDVSPDLIQMGRTFNSWKVNQVDVPDFLAKSKSPKQEIKQKSSEFQMKKPKEKQQKKETVSIVLAKNYSLEHKKMRDQIINRAKNNKLLQENSRMTQLQKIGTQINYILNRITEDFFSEFLEELRPYAQDQIYSIILSDKIIFKVMEEHNYINIYCKLVKKLKGVKVLVGGETVIKFKSVFVSRLQQNFYELIRHGQWQNKQEFYKKQLLGLSSFIGELFNIRFLSKYIFSDCFYELIRGYISQYYKHKQNKTIIFYETYVECAVRIIEKMGGYYDQLLLKKNTDDLDQVIRNLILSVGKEESNFQYICDYMEILKILNHKLPSNRSKITFLLEDFRCSKHLQKEKENLNNKEYQIIKDILSLDTNKQQKRQKIPQMIKNCNFEVLMKDYLFQFAEGTIKQVNKNIELYKFLSEIKGICDATVSAFKKNIEGLFLIQSDFPFMSEGLARMMKTVCQVKRVSYQELNLGENDEQDEDIRWFLQGIEGKYFKMIMQD